MNHRQKEQYLREYSVLKAQGKPFFPYAVAKDGAMACVVHARDHHDVDRPGRRARPQGRPDDDHLRAAARVVLLLPLRAAARHQAGGPHADRDDRHPDGLHRPADPAAVLRPRARAPSRAPADRHHRGHPRHLRDGLPDLPRRGGRARRPRSTSTRPKGLSAAGREGVRRRQARRRAVGLPGLPQVRGERQRRPGPEPDGDRRPIAAGGDRAHAGQPDRADALLQGPAGGEVQQPRRLPLAC